MSENVVFTRVISTRHVSGAVSLYEPPCFSHVIPPFSYIPGVQVLE